MSTEKKLDGSLDVKRVVCPLQEKEAEDRRVRDEEERTRREKEEMERKNKVASYVTLNNCSHWARKLNVRHYY